MLKQLYLLLPLLLLVAFICKYPFWKIFPIGLITLLIGFCFRALVLGVNASCFGQQVAAGWMDTLARFLVVLATFVIVFCVVAKSKKGGADELETI